MFCKIVWILNWLKIIFNRKISCSGFVKIDPAVELIISPNSKLIIGKNCHVRKNSIIALYGGATVVLHDNVFLGHGTTLAAHEKIELGAGTMSAEYVSLRDHDHNYSGKEKTLSQRGVVTGAITIGKNVWLGAKTTVTKGVSIGNDAVIGANSVVTRSIPSKTIAVGAPAKGIKKI